MGATRRPASFAATSATATVVLASTASILEVVVTPVVSITIASTLTNTILATSVRLVCVISTCSATRTTAPPSTLTRWTLVPEDKRAALIKDAKESNAAVIDVVQHGYYKVLGKGELPRLPSLSRLASSRARPRSRLRPLAVSA